jgi:predicted CopG family antitoxin
VRCWIVPLDEDAYTQLQASKKPRESVSDLIRRLLEQDAAPAARESDEEIDEELSMRIQGPLDAERKDPDAIVRGRLRRDRVTADVQRYRVVKERKAR